MRVKGWLRKSAFSLWLGLSMLAGVRSDNIGPNRQRGENERREMEFGSR